MQSYTKMRSTRYNDVIMKVIPGHFVTPNSHINYYIDMTTMKTRQNEAKAAARAMSEDYVASTVVDTIVCMDGMEVIGAYMAEELTKAGIMSMNAHKTIYIMSPEYDLAGQMIVRENNQMMVRGKHCLLLLASATTVRPSPARASRSIITEERSKAFPPSIPLSARSWDIKYTRCIPMQTSRIINPIRRVNVKCARAISRSTPSATALVIPGSEFKFIRPVFSKTSFL